MKNSLKSLFLLFLIIFTSCKQEANKENIDNNTVTESLIKDPLPSWNDTSTKKEIIAYV